ncbi:hypothetical protein, partial [Streptococcus suis]
ERRKMNIKSYAKEQVQKQHNEATKKRLLKQRSKRLGQEVVMPSGEPSLGAFEVKPHRKMKR